MKMHCFPKYGVHVVMSFFISGLGSIELFLNQKKLICNQNAVEIQRL